MELIAIQPGSSPEEQGLPEGSAAGMNYRLQVEYYATIGFNPPWVGFLAKKNGAPVGMGGFKGKPVNNRIEIAYFTFPENEGKGMGTETCRALVEKALAQDPTVVVTARTLPESNASTRILGKNGFVRTAVVQDPEDGEVWEWTYQPKRIAGN